MSDLKFYKEIGSLPQVLNPDSVYAIRTGPGFDFYLTDTTGSVAYKTNSDPSSIETVGDVSDFTAALEAAISNNKDI